jgi:hypothetical protein
MIKIMRVLILMFLTISIFVDSAKSHVASDHKIKTFTDDTCRCNHNCWPALGDSTMNLTTGQIFNFLKTFDIECNNNAEFSEWSNEKLFKIIEFNADNFLKSIEIHKADLNFDYILKEFGSPVNDGIDIKLVYKKVEQTKDNSNFKKQVLQILKQSGLVK